MRYALLCLIGIMGLIGPAAADRLKVVASFSIVGDMVSRVGGEHVDVSVLVGPDNDAHEFEPTPAHARSLATADIVFANGLGFEPWLARLARATNASARIVELSRGISPRQAGASQSGKAHAHGHGHSSDPHAWQDVRNAIIYVENIANALSSRSPAMQASFRARALAFTAELRALDSEIRSSMALVPEGRRRVITSHDAFGYYADAYGVVFLAPLGTSTEAQPSAKGVARLIEQIRREKIRVVFVENITDPRLIEQIARETGASVGGRLFSDALSGPTGPAPDYQAMMRHNTRLLTAAMASGS
jgi:zinc/manganese transport system substrate-binding protein